MTSALVRLSEIGKSFSGISVLEGINLELRPGSVHALLGENGAGKSTLMKVLAGIHQASSGRVLVRGEEQQLQNAQQSQDLGIAMIHQELMYVPDLSIAENMYLGHEPRLMKLGFVDKRRLFRDTEQALSRLGLEFSPDEKMRNLNVSQRQLIEIAKAISRNADILIMDEPTSALEDREIERLFEIMRGLTERGAGIIYISHKMKEIFSIADDYTVLRDGRLVGSGKIKETTQQEVIASMVGRPLAGLFSTGERGEPGGVVFEVQALERTGVFADISFNIRAGEIVGFGGLMGAGRTEVMRCLYGLDRYTSGVVKVDGEAVSIDSPAAALSHGIALVSDDRKNIGLVLGLSIRKNLTLQNPQLISHFGFIDAAAESELSANTIREFSIRSRSEDQIVSTLSGGNQQKVVLGKVLLSKPRVLILDEPTRGIDVGAKAEIYKLIQRLAEQGVAVILVSSELPELIGLSDRIVVFRSGRIAGQLSRAEATETRIMEYAFSHN
ncbi:MAG: sugar ABC transporter ATP-binding protein [Propionivibrio sp.]